MPHRLDTEEPSATLGPVLRSGQPPADPWSDTSNAPAAQRLREQEIRSRRRAPATLRFLEAKSPAELRQLLAGKVVTVVRVGRTLP
jgi:hypothetical protein